MNGFGREPENSGGKGDEEENKNHSLSEMDRQELVDRIKEIRSTIQDLSSSTEGSEGNGNGSHLEPARVDDPFDWLFDNVQDALFLVEVREEDGDYTFHYVRINERARAFLNVDSEGFVGKTPGDILSDKKSEYVRDQFLQCVREKEVVTFEGIFELFGKEDTWNVKVTPWVVDGRVENLLLAARPITEQRQIERELHIKSRAMDDSPIGLLITDPSLEDNPIIYANRGFSRLTGYPEDEVVGRNCRFLQGEDTDPETVKRIREAVRNEEMITVDIRNYRKQGSLFWNRLTISPITDRDGSVTHFLGFQQDVTQHKIREQELELFRKTLDHHPDSIMIIDPDTARFLDVNETATELLGYEREELLQMRVHDIDPELGEEIKWEDLLDQLEGKGPNTIETVHQSRDGETFPVEVHADVAEIQGERRIISATRNISKRKLAEEKAREQTEFMESINDTMPGVSFRFRRSPDGEYSFVYLSKGFEAVTGVPSSKALNEFQKVLENVHPEDRDELLESIEESARTLEDWRHECRFFFSDGRVKWGRGYSIPEPQPAGSIIWTGVLIDVTEEKKAEQSLKESEKRHRTLFEQSNEAILIESYEDEILDANPSAAELLGYDREELKGMDVTRITPSEIAGDPDESGIIRGRLQEHGDSVFHTRYVRKDGSEVPVEITKSTIQIGQQQIVMTFLRDLSEIEKARRKSRMKSTFVARVTHDLRTPLNSILGMGQILNETSLDPEQNKTLRIMLNAARTMERLTDDILDLNRIEQGKLELNENPFTPRNLIGEVISLNWQDIQELDLELNSEVSSEVPDRLIGDSDRLTQVLHNLIKNAVKHTSEGYITLEVGVKRAEGDTYELEWAVSDSGCGIPEEEQEKIFERHSQLTGATGGRHKSGVGLGLSICRELVELMNGEISVESEVGEGATFTFTTRHEKADESTLEEPENVRVLLVEDNPHVRNVYRTYLESHNIHVTERTTGEQVLDELTQPDASSYDAVLLDRRLGNIRGTDVIQNLCADKDGYDPERICIVSGDPAENIRAELQGLNIGGILEKPLSESELVNAVFSIVDSPHIRASEESKTILNRLKNHFSESDTILIVDDDTDARLLLEEYLSPITDQVQFGRDGADALSSIREQRPTVILMDLEMPTMDGLEATRRIREEEKTKNLERTPIIAQTAKAMTHIQEKSRKAGVDAFLRKPIDRLEIYRTLEEVLVPGDPELDDPE